MDGSQREATPGELEREKHAERREAERARAKKPRVQGVSEADPRAKVLPDEIGSSHRAQSRSEPSGPVTARATRAVRAVVQIELALASLKESLGMTGHEEGDQDERGSG